MPKKDCIKKGFCSLVLVGYGEQVALFNAQLGSSLNDLLHVFDDLLSRSSLPVAMEHGEPKGDASGDITLSLWTQSECGYLQNVLCLYIYIHIRVCVYIYIYACVYVWGAGEELLVQKLIRKLSMLGAYIYTKGTGNLGKCRVLMKNHVFPPQQKTRFPPTMFF